MKEEDWSESLVVCSKSGALKWRRRIFAKEFATLNNKHTLIKERKKWRPRRHSSNQPRTQKS